MATTEKNYQIVQKVAADEYLLLHPETDAAIVLLAAEGITANNVKDALIELKGLISNITESGVVTGVKGESESSFRQGNVNITKANVGLGNVDNTSDANKPVSTAQKEAIDKKQDKLTFDISPTDGSNNPVTSGGVKTAIDAAKSAVTAQIPDVSQFITKTVNDLVNYYTKTQIDGKVSDLQSQISAIPKFAISVVAELPTSNISTTTIYLLKTSESESGNLYTEYIYVNNAWEELGTQTLDLSGYATQTWVNAQIADFITESEVNTLITNALSAYVKSTELATIAKSGKLSDATEDATHRVVTDTEKATWNAKQNALTFDDAPTTDSSNPVKSSGVKSAVQAVQDAVDDIVDGTTKAAKATTSDSATSAGKLSTARTITLKGDATGSASFDGSADKDIQVTFANSGVTAGSYSAVTVDAKGRVTKGAQLVEVGDEGQEAPSANLATGGLFFKLM